MEIQETQEADIQIIRQEYQEFQEQAKEYEEALEAEITEKQEKLENALRKIGELKESLSHIKQKYDKDEKELAWYQGELEKLKSTLKKCEEQKRALEQLNDQWENTVRALEFSKQDLEEKLYQAEENSILYQEELSEYKIQTEIEIQRLKDQCNELSQEIESLRSQADMNQVSSLEKEVSELLFQRDELQKLLEQKENSISLNHSSAFTPRSMQSSLSFPEPKKAQIKVLVRIRPAQNKLKPCSLTCFSGEIQTNPTVEKLKNQRKTFSFEKVFGQNASTNEVFQEIMPSIEKVSLGGRTCILAYGQTGSGKTHTMSGLIAESLSHLSKLLKCEETKVSIQCIEIYNEQIKNLLRQEPNIKNWMENVNIADMKFEGNWVPEVIRTVNEAFSKRITKSTQSNENSSRSHMVFTLIISFRNYEGTIQFVDLAGSERLNKSQTKGDTLKETVQINKSLSALVDVIGALESKQSHIPYRNSMLTKVLKPTLGETETDVNAIMNCSPEIENYNEAICTLELGSRLKSVDLDWVVKRNKTSQELEKTLKLLGKERDEKAMLVGKLEKMGKEIDELEKGIKERDTKLSTLMNKIKVKDKSSIEEVENLRKELINLKKSQDLNISKAKAGAIKTETEVKKKKQESIITKHKAQSSKTELEVSKMQLEIVNKTSTDFNRKKLLEPKNKPSISSKTEIEKEFKRAVEIKSKKAELEEFKKPVENKNRTLVAKKEDSQVFKKPLETKTKIHIIKKVKEDSSKPLEFKTKIQVTKKGENGELNKIIENNSKMHSNKNEESGRLNLKVEIAEIVNKIDKREIKEQAEIETPKYRVVNKIAKEEVKKIREANKSRGKMVTKLGKENLVKEHLDNNQVVEIKAKQEFEIQPKFIIKHESNAKKLNSSILESSSEFKNPASESQTQTECKNSEFQALLEFKKPTSESQAPFLIQPKGRSKIPAPKGKILNNN
ncbi:unnamed protein product [Blepharisma stoltei]|uniref:Kinesin-like protein n=1 Tax=Blepharisma stoltei TaxID=1481888 RepID=A0AAU9KAL7_9CILI|nr:unnamed protein product [Blepharisma stoltei]